MAEQISTHHQPAVKVGGRRLSVSTKPKAHHDNHSSSPPKEEAASTVEVTDYPRPAPPGEEHPEVHHYNDEEVVRSKEKKHHDVREQKVKPNLPTRDAPIANKGFGGGGRIDQPAGKGFNA